MTQKSLDKKKTNKAEWEKDYYDRFANIENGRRMYYPIRDFIRSLLSHQRQEILEEIKADIMDIVHTSDGTTDWFHGLRCAAGVCESKLSALLQVKNKNEKTDQ